MRQEWAESNPDQEQAQPQQAKCLTAAVTVFRRDSPDRTSENIPEYNRTPA